MRKKIKLAVLPLLFSIAGWVAPQSLHAQVTYTTPQAVTAVLATNLACTGAPQNFITNQGIPNYRNLGQTQHYITMSVTGTTTAQAEIDGIDSNGNILRLSDVMYPSPAGLPLEVKGTGAPTNVQISVTCSPNTGTFTLNYVGTSSTTNENVGSYLLGQIDKTIFANVSANANHLGPLFQTPFGNSLGTVLFSGSNVPTGSTLTVVCNGNTAASASQIFPLKSGTVSSQLIPIPATPCPTIFANYNTGGASVGAINLEYIFGAPGLIPVPSGVNTYTHVTGTAATAAKATGGTLHTLTVNTPAAGTISIFDLGSASCTGTPATNVVAVLTILAATSPETVVYDTNLSNGICVQASAAMDLTVSSQ